MKKLSIISRSMMIAMSLVGIAAADQNNGTGFYAGANAGFVFNNVQLQSQQLGFTDPSETCNTSADFSSFFPGIQVGYLYQFANHLVSGIEANVTVNTHQKETLSCNSDINLAVYDGFSFRNQMQTSIKGRVGYALSGSKGMLIPYFTAGASIANFGLTYQNEGGDHDAKNTTSPGWLIGAGLEWVFSQHWSVRAEYSYVDYGNVINLNIPSVYGLIDTNGGAHANLSANNIVVSINYWI